MKISHFVIVRECPNSDDQNDLEATIEDVMDGAATEGYEFLAGMTMQETETRWPRIVIIMRKVDE